MFTLMSYKTERLPHPLEDQDIVGDGLIHTIAREAEQYTRPGVSGNWTVREKHNGVWVPVMRRKNILTNFGLTALASAYGNQFTIPNWLVYDNTDGLVYGTPAIGDTSVYTYTSPFQAGEVSGGGASIVVGAGTSTQETVGVVTETAYSGYYGYTLATPLVSLHYPNDPCVRLPVTIDTLASVMNEQSFDPSGFLNQRAPSTAGYSSGIGTFVLQFYILTTQANGTNGGAFFGNVGTADKVTMGQGNLHNLYALGYTHTNASDCEIDCVITITNT